MFIFSVMIGWISGDFCFIESGGIFSVMTGWISGDVFFCHWLDWQYELEPHMSLYNSSTHKLSI